MNIDQILDECDRRREEMKGVEPAPIAGNWTNRPHRVDEVDNLALAVASFGVAALGIPVVSIPLALMAVVGATKDLARK